MEERIIPKCESEGDEANWWFDNREVFGKDLERAFAEVRLRLRESKAADPHPELLAS